MLFVQQDALPWISTKVDDACDAAVPIINDLVVQATSAAVQLKDAGKAAAVASHAKVRDVVEAEATKEFVKAMVSAKESGVDQTIRAASHVQVKWNSYWEEVADSTKGRVKKAKKSGSYTHKKHAEKKETENGGMKKHSGKKKHGGKHSGQSKKHGGKGGKGKKNKMQPNGDQPAERAGMEGSCKRQKTQQQDSEFEWMKTPQ